MPNRIIKESICRSDSIDKLTWIEECLFYRLIVQCDDFGYFDGRPQVIKSYCFPLKESLRISEIEKAISHLEEVGMLKRIETNGKQFIQLPTWEAHQRIRNKKCRYPEIETIRGNMHTLDSESLSSDSNTQTFVPARAESNPIQSNPIQSELESNTNISAESETDSVPEETPEPHPEEPVMYKIPLQDHTEFGVTESYYRTLVDLYPAADIDREIRKMLGWIDANPSRRKTRRGIKAFITSWLSRVQDSGGFRQAPPNQQPSTVERFAARTESWVNNGT